MRKVISIFVFSIFMIGIYTNTFAAKPQNDVQVTEVCRNEADENVIWFKISGVDDKIYIRESTWGATKFDQFFTILLTARASNRPISFHDSEISGSDRFDEGWLILK